MRSSRVVEEAVLGALADAHVVRQAAQVEQRAQGLDVGEGIDFTENAEIRDLDGAGRGGAGELALERRAAQRDEVQREVQGLPPTATAATSGLPPGGGV